MARQNEWDPSKLQPPPGQEHRLIQDAAALRSVLDQEGSNQGGDQRPKDCGPLLVALSGLPGTGKSHFARASRPIFLVASNPE